MVSEIKKDLRSLSGLLSTWRNVKNPNILQNIVFTEIGDSRVKYSIFDTEPLTFINVDLDRHCIPSGIEKFKSSEIDFEVKLMSNYVEFDNKSEFIDPINELGVRIIAEIFYPDGNDVRDANCSWHLDKGAPSDSIFSHPIYHMNFGGSHMTKQGNTFGKLLLLTAPRIIHPPMDIILSCDFIIRNFYTKEKHIKITELPSYKTILDKAKLRYWKPYGQAFVSNWDKGLAVKNLSSISLFGH